MPTKKVLSLFDVSGKEPPKEKAPTLLQYLKSLNNEQSFPIYSPIETIWFPGNWDNYSVECRDFRASIRPNHPLYPVLDAEIVKVFSGTDTAILFRLDDRAGCCGFSESNVYGAYKPIGNAGYRFELTVGAN